MKEMKKKMTKKEFDYQIDRNSFKEKNVKSKKFLVVFDGFKFSESALEYAIQLSKEADAFLVGVFLDEFIYRTYSVAQILTSYKNGEELIKELDEKDKEKRDESVRKFEKVCGQASINYSFHRNVGVAIQELKQESIFADLIVINDSETFNRLDENTPPRFIKELLADVQCPVLIVPDKFKPIDKITLLYDGAPSSVFAIKMFSYLFSYLQDVPIDVLTIIEKDIIAPQLPGTILMTDFLGLRFSNFTSKLLKGNAEEMIISHLLAGGENQFVVLGAYRRSGFSRWLKPSMADTLMIGLDLPLFIAHD